MRVESSALIAGSSSCFSSSVWQTGQFIATGKLAFESAIAQEGFVQMKFMILAVRWKIQT